MEDNLEQQAKEMVADLDQIDQKYKDNPLYHDTFDLGTTIIKFTLPRLKLFLEVGGAFVNLESEHTSFDYKEEKITLKKAIEIIIEDQEKVVEDDYTEESQEINELFGKIIRYLWW